MSVKLRSLRLALFGTAVFCLPAMQPAGSEHPPHLSAIGTPPTRDLKASPPRSSAGRLPVEFVENRGQWNTPARFVAREGRITAFFEERAITLHATGEASPALRFAFEGASSSVRPMGDGTAGGRYNFYISNDPLRWRADVRGYDRLMYRGLYDGIDLVVRDVGRLLEYDLLLAPTADLDRVVIAAEGASALEIAADGALVMHTRAGPLHQTAPRSWEVLPDGTRRPIASRFHLLGGNRYGFQAPEHDDRLPLVVDPGIEWSTFIGGSGPDFIGPAVVARDGSGDVFVGGTMKSPDFPLFSDPSFAFPIQDRAFIARLDSSGTSILYATFVGGWHAQLVWRGLAVDAGGNAVLAGQTFSPDFPTTAGAVDRIGENKDAFVFRVDAFGQLIFSTFLGGLSEDLATSVDYDPAGNIIVGGSTTSSDFPTTPGAFDTTYNVPNAPADGGANGDMFVTQLSPDGSQILYSTFIGGPSVDYLEDLVVDPQGNVTVVGWVTGNNVQVFVTTASAFDRTWNGSQDAALARLKLDAAGSADLKYATLLGGASQDNFWTVALQPGNPEIVTLAGRTWSFDYPVTAGVVRQTNPGFSELFPNAEAGILTRFRFPAAGGGTLQWSTYHHGDRITGLTVNEAGESIVAGASAPWDRLPTTVGAFDRTADGSGATHGGFIGRLSANATQYLYQTFFGGSVGVADNFDTSPQIAHVVGNTVIISGQTSSNDFPITPRAADPTSSNPAASANEGFVTRIALDRDASGDLSVDPPSLSSPADGAVFHNGAIGRLEWSSVFDASGVESYEFQMSGKPDFANGFIVHRGAIDETEVLVPPSVGNSGGLPNATMFWRVRTSDNAGNLSVWSEVRSFTISSTTGRVTVSGIGVHPPSNWESGPTGGTQLIGAAYLYDPAPAGGAVVRLTTHHDRTAGFDRLKIVPLPATVPATVTIPAGAMSATFPINTSAVTALSRVTIVGTVGGIGNQGTFTLMPAAAPKPALIMFAPRMVTGGTSATGTVTLNAAAPAGGTVLSLESSHPGAASVPASVTVPAGLNSASFPVTTFPVSVEVDPQITARSAGEQWTGALYVRPPGLPTLTGMTVSPASVAGGSDSGGTLTFSGPIPLGRWPAYQDGFVRISSSDPDAAAVFPTDEFVLAGVTSHNFRIFTRGVPTARTVTITASFDGVSLSRVLTVGAVAATVASITANVTNLKGGEGGVATVALSAPAPATILINVSTSHPTLFSSLPATVSVFKGSTTAMLGFVANKTATTTAAVTVTAAYGASSRNLGLTIGPPAEATPVVSSVTLTPSTISSGGTATGTVTLSGAAPAGGASVQLSTGDVTVATVPPSVTVAAGATSATFTVTAQNVTATRTTSIWGLLNLSAAAGLTVTAGGGGGGGGGGGAPGFLSPAANAAESGGDGNGFESNPSSALADDAASAADVNSGSGTGTSCTSTGKDRHRFFNYGVAIPSGASITGIEVRLDARADSTSGSPKMCVQLSWDGGTTWTAAKATGTLGTTMTTFTLGSAIDTWGRTWSAANVADASFRVRVINVASSTSRDFSLDWIAVRVHAGTAGPASLSAVSVSPSTVTGGSPSTGTVTLTAAAPTGGAVVSVTSSTTAATVPPTVTVAAGATTATFTVATQTVATSTGVTISATYSGVTRTAVLTVNPQASGDTVAIQRAEYDDRDEQLRVEATSTSATATLQVFVTSTNQLIGTLTNNGGGRYSRTFSNIATNPQNITVRSSLGGSATRTVTTN